MTLPEISVKRPVFIASLVALIFFLGVVSLKNLPVSLLPETRIPYISVSVVYPGAGPREIEHSITKHLEDELSTVEGLKKITTFSQDSLAVVWIEFRGGLNFDSLELKVRDKVSLARVKFPREAEMPLIEWYNPSNQPVLTAFIPANKKSHLELTTWVEQDVKPSLTRVPQVGRVDIYGGLKRQIDIVVDPKKIEEFRIPLLMVADRLIGNGQNIPAGSLLHDDQELSLRALGQFRSLADVDNKVVAFGSGETPIRVKDLGRTVESSEKVRSQAYFNGERGVVLRVFRQSGANTIAVADAVKNEIKQLNKEFAKSHRPEIKVVSDGSEAIRNNVADVWESIGIGVCLTILVVFVFLGSLRSTLITGFAIPNSLMGAFILMFVAGFSINIMTLLALSLCVGLLVDDAIVVRENIFKHIEAGQPPRVAAIMGANEVAMAVVAVTAAILSMFGPVGFLQGVTGQMFKEFGLVVCFAMLVSLFDALAVAPMLSAVWADQTKVRTGPSNGELPNSLRTQFLNQLERLYGHFLKTSLKRPALTLALVLTAAVAIGSLVRTLPSSFLPTDQSAEFSVRLMLSPGTSLEVTLKSAQRVDKYLRENSFVESTVMTVGSGIQELHKSEFTVRLKAPKYRQGQKPSQIREQMRVDLENLPNLPTDAEVFVGGAGAGTFGLLIQARDLSHLEALGKRVLKRLKKLPVIRSPELELKPGAAELQVVLRDNEAHRLGITPSTAGMELRARLEGMEVGKLRENGFEYKIKLRTNDPSLFWLKRESPILVPNVNMTPVDLRKAADFIHVRAPAKIERVNRAYTARITADLAENASIDKVLKSVQQIADEESKGFNDVETFFEGDAESFDELSHSMSIAFLFGIVLLFLVLSSLYESFVLGVLNIVTLPLAVSGAFFSLWIMGEGINIYSAIGILLLLGVATKNSILLIDTAASKLREGQNLLLEEIISASVSRLRPILMTSLALVAGCIPIAIGLNEASAQRTGMGVAIVGGTITSTLFTLVFVPALLVLVERLRRRMNS